MITNWYINGGSVEFEVDVVSYIGTDDTSFSESVKIPEHSSVTYRYVLEDIDGGTYLPDYSNKYAIVPVSTYGSYTVTIDNTLYGIKDALKGGDVKFKATLYSAPEKLEFNFNTKQSNDSDSTVSIACYAKDASGNYTQRVKAFL